jgi:Holliday junction resolvasome RuvABC endonuclease subunit
MTLILGIDPGINVTGFALLSAGGPRRVLLETGTLEADTKRPWLERVDWQSSAFVGLLGSKEPTVVCCESYVYQGPRSHNPAAFWMARLVGRVEGIAVSRGVQVVTLDKQACNRALGLTGKVSAARIRQMIEAMFRKSPATDHECDAVLAAVGGAQRVALIGKRGAA